MMKKIVIKVGTSSISENNSICLDKIDALASLISDLRKKYKVILVSSGAVVAGYSILNIDSNVVNKQVLASIGQPKLMSIYKQAFRKKNITVAQLLLSALAFDSRKQTLNARNNVNKLLDYDILPIINENDVITVKEIIFGDNDQLSASVCYYFDCNMLVMLSDIDGYYDKDPNKYSNAQVLKNISSISKDSLSKTPSPNDSFATGGILTKLLSANFLLKNHKKMFLVNSNKLNDVREYLLNDNYVTGTLFEKL
jgi:glutamate 5-kinase